MENEQLVNRIEWLDEELRKQKNQSSQLQEKFEVMEGKLDAAEKTNKDLDSEVTRLRSVISRVDKFDDALAEFRVDYKRQEKDIQKDIKTQVAEAKKVIDLQIQNMEERLKTANQQIEQLESLEKEMADRTAEEERLNDRVRELSQELAEVQRKGEEQQRRYEMVIEDREKERKRMVDIQGELTAARKRIDEQAGAVDLVKTDLVKITNRVEEFDQLRRELKAEQNTFLEQQALRTAERENTWKKWKDQIDNLDRKKAELDEKMKALDSTHREVKRTQETIEDLAEHVDRRVNEITEMQRLSEEKFQQEWKMFKADDQKRWTTYTLRQQEERSEIERYTRDLGERLTAVEDHTQELQDQIRQISAESEKQLQSLLSQTRKWVDDYQQVMDSIG